MSDNSLYWNEVEKEYQKAKGKDVVEQAKRNQKLAEKVSEVKRRLPESMKDRLRQEIRASAPSKLGLGLDCPQKDETLVEAEMNTILNQIAQPIAERELQRETLQKRRGRIGFKQNPMAELSNQDQNHRWLKELAELLPQIQHGRNIIRKHTDLQAMLLYPTDLTALGSLIRSWNNMIIELSQSGYQLQTFEPLPQSKPERMNWIQGIRSGTLLTDEELEAQNRLIATYLSRPITIRL